MTYEQKQCCLKFYGCYDGAIDGLWGPKSEEGTKKFQEKCGLTADGIFGTGTIAKVQELMGAGVWTLPGDETDKDINVPTTGTFWDDSEFFNREEFRCQCKGKYCNGFPVEPDEKMVRTVNEIRRRLGVPISVVDAGGSGVRCKQHNANVGGVANSEHLYGRAADLHSSASPAKMKAVAEEVMGNTGGIGLYSWGIHVDVGKYSRWNG